MGARAGLLAGAGVGILEALWVLSSAGAASDFVALFYAALLYGLLGAALGALLGAPLCAPALVGRPLSREGVWTLSFLSISTPLAVGLARAHLRAPVSGGGALPQTVELALLGAAAVYVTLGLLLVPRLVSRTPLKVLRERKGALAAWGALGLIAAVFSFTPGPDPDGELAPERHQEPELGRRPNLLVVVVDALRADALEPYGGPPTPAAARLAADGVVFEQAYAHATSTRASVASLMSSTLPSAHQAATSALSDSADTLAEALSRGGYVTGGLPNHEGLTRHANLQQGFDYYHYMAPDLPLLGTESVSRLWAYQQLVEALERLSPGEARVTDFYRPAPEVVEAAQRFIEAQGPRRWMLWVHLMEPHAPCFGADGQRIRGAPGAEALHACYAEEVQAADQGLGALLDWLDSTGRYADTLILLTADHGEELGEHGGAGHGDALYQEQLHVPLIVKLAGQELAGRRARWRVRHIDVAPTLVELAGVASGAGWRGEPLLEELARAALMEADAPTPPDLLVLAEQSVLGLPMVAVIDGNWKLIRAAEGNPRGLPPVQLFDLNADPGETRDVARQHGARVTALSRISGELLREAGGESAAADSARLKALGYAD
ncbi:MAG: sulfatase [Alphaproteobacteria bacterium]|nr:sulfatase [Alphaproteobacteria bacterium]